MSTRRKIPINNYEAGPAESGVASGDAVETTTTIHTAPDESTLDGAERSSPERTPGTASGPETAAGDVAPPPSNDTDAMDELLAEREELGDALLRLRAEFDNYRKRSVQELVESRERAQGEILCDLLPVLDNLERALDAAEHHDEGKVLDGVRMTRDMFVDLLKRTGVEEIETVGASFDPEVHEAIFMQPSAVDEGTVVAELQRGYRQGDRLLRPSRVVVSSGPADTSDGEV